MRKKKVTVLMVVEVTIGDDDDYSRDEDEVVGALADDLERFDFSVSDDNRGGKSTYTVTDVKGSMSADAALVKKVMEMIGG